jgi:hypothetical protein
MPNNFSRFDRSIANFLTHLPRIKKPIKLMYQYFLFFLHKNEHLFNAKFSLNSPNLTAHTFFGYYDKSPINNAGYLLCHESSLDTSKYPDPHTPIRICLFSPDLKDLLWSDSTTTYNWQQGARLHWLNDDLFIYNDFDTTRSIFISKVISSKSLSQIKSFSFPVQDSFQTDFFLSINYRRLMTLRPDYGYRNLPKMTDLELHQLSTDGIWRVDYQTGDSELLVSIQEVCSIQPSSNFFSAYHKVNHVMISPDGDHFIFLHRYFIGQHRFDRLMLADSHTGELKLLSDYGMVSHYFWINDKTILSYMRGPEEIDSYYLIDIVSGVFRQFTALEGLGDGHPHVYGDWFITDTYPDKARMQQLNLVNWKTDEVKNLGEFFHGFEYYGESRCDLHPRFSRCGKVVFFDSVFSGKRKLYEMRLVD